MAIISKTIKTENIGTHNVTIKQDHTGIKDIMFKAYIPCTIHNQEFSKTNQICPKQFRRREQMYLKDLHN